MGNFKKFMRFYNNDEIESMNFIFGKNGNNTWFSQEELSFANNVDLMDKSNLESVRNDWITSYFN
jgi:hypothetical protein